MRFTEQEGHYHIREGEACRRSPGGSFAYRVAANQGDDGLATRDSTDDDDDDDDTAEGGYRGGHRLASSRDTGRMGIGPPQPRGNGGAAQGDGGGPGPWQEGAPQWHGRVLAVDGRPQEAHQASSSSVSEGEAAISVRSAGIGVSREINISNFLRWCFLFGVL